MNICLIYPGFPPETHSGGIGTFAFEFAMALQKAGHAVTVISRSDNTHTDAHEIIEGINVYRIADSASLSFRAGGELFHYERIKNLVKKLDTQSTFDIIEACDWGAEAYALLSDYSARLLIRCHTPSFISESYNPENPAYLSEKIKSCEKRLLSTAQKLISPSQALLTEISKYISFSGKTIVEPYLIQTNDIPYKNIYSLSTIPSLLSVGRIEARKGQDIIIQALHEISTRELHLTLYGSDTPISASTSILDQWLSEVPKLVASNVKHLGCIPRDSMLRSYKDFDIYICSSRFDNYPFTVLEAMAAGLPVIAHNVSGMKEQIIDGETGMFFDGSPADLAEKISILLADETLRAQIGRRARQQIESHHSPKSIENSVTNMSN